MTDSITSAANLEVLAKEIAAAAGLYKRLITQRDSLAAGLESLVDALNHNYGIFLRKRAEEAAGG